MATELSLVSLRSSPGGGAMTSVIATTREPHIFILRNFATALADPPSLFESAFLLPPLELHQRAVIIGLHVYDAPHRPRLTCALLLPAKADTRGRDRDGSLRAG